MMDASGVEQQGHNSSVKRLRLGVKAEDVGGQGPGDPDIGHVLSSLGPEARPQHDTGERHDPVDGQTFQFDENTLKSIQQFMQSQAFQATANIDSATVKPTSSLAAEIAQHYLPTREDTRPETEQERKARLERVRIENRERKKKWRQQNSDRNKDNDLRCRVNKKATLLFGVHPSPQKSAYMDEEFNKRKQRRKGKQSSPEDIGSERTAQGEDMYSSLLNNPEFTNVLMGLLAQKGVEVGGEETTKQLVELLKSHPEFLRGFLAGGGQGEQHGGVGVGEIVDGGDETGLQGRKEAVVEGGMQLGGEEVQRGAMETEFREMHGTNMGLPTVGTTVNLEDPPADQHQSAFTGGQVAPSPEPLPTTAPIPQLSSPIAVESTPISAPTAPAASPQAYPSIPIPPPFQPSTIIHSPPPPERIQAFGFPPRVGQSQR